MLRKGEEAMLKGLQKACWHDAQLECGRVVLSITNESTQSQVSLIQKPLTGLGVDFFCDPGRVSAIL